MDKQKNNSLTEEQIAQINNYIIEMSYYLPDEIRSSEKWQKDSSEVLSTLGIS